jgi:hypothetical protein
MRGRPQFNGARGRGLVRRPPLSGPPSSAPSPTDSFGDDDIQILSENVTHLPAPVPPAQGPSTVGVMSPGERDQKWSTRYTSTIEHDVRYKPLTFHLMETFRIFFGDP